MGLTRAHGGCIAQLLFVALALLFARTARAQATNESAAGDQPDTDFILS